MINRITQALVFAAGRGERMRPLTTHTPKPLLHVAGKRLIEWHLERLARCGIENVVINISHLAEQFPEILGDGERFGLSIRYSHEGPEPLETGGGMLHALSKLRESHFLLVNGDVWTDADFEPLLGKTQQDAWLCMVPPPGFATQGDFHLDDDGLITGEMAANATYAGVGVFHPNILSRWQECVSSNSVHPHFPHRFKLAPVLRQAMRAHRVRGAWLQGRWVDVGTPERLAQLDQSLNSP